MGWIRPGLVATSQGNPPLLHPDAIVLHDTCDGKDKEHTLSSIMHLSKALLHKFH